MAVTAEQYGEAHQAVKVDVSRQVLKQVEKWGFQRHTFEEWRAILDEEFSEAVCQIVAAKETGYKELTHVAAVVHAWMIDIRLRIK